MHREAEILQERRVRSLPSAGAGFTRVNGFEVVMMNSTNTKV